jgi:hypothetical protein
MSYVGGLQDVICDIWTFFFFNHMSYLLKTLLMEAILRPEYLQDCNCDKKRILY